MTTTDTSASATPEQPLVLHAAAIAAADRADREHQADQARRQADNAERASTSAVAILRRRLGVATSPTDWAPIGQLDDNYPRSATATVDGLSFLAVERYSSDLGCQSALYLLRPCPVEGCVGREQAEVGSPETLGWLLRDPQAANGSFSCPTCEYRAWRQREADREAEEAAQPQAPPPSAAEVLAEALRTLIREETAAALEGHQAGWQHQGGV